MRVVQLGSRPNKSRANPLLQPAGEEEHDRPGDHHDNEGDCQNLNPDQHTYPHSDLGFAEGRATCPPTNAVTVIQPAQMNRTIASGMPTMSDTVFRLRSAFDELMADPDLLA